MFNPKCKVSTLCSHLRLSSGKDHAGNANSAVQNQCYCTCLGASTIEIYHQVDTLNIRREEINRAISQEYQVNFAF